MLKLKNKGNKDKPDRDKLYNSLIENGSNMTILYKKHAINNSWVEAKFNLYQGDYEILY